MSEALKKDFSSASLMKLMRRIGVTSKVSRGALTSTLLSDGLRRKREIVRSIQAHGKACLVFLFHRRRKSKILNSLKMLKFLEMLSLQSRHNFGARVLSIFFSQRKL